MNVQYMKLGVVYSYNIVFWKPIHQMIFSSTHWALCICDNDRNYRIYTLLIVEHYISFHGTPWKNIIWTTQTKIFPFHNGKIIKYIYFQKPKSLLKEVDGKLWILLKLESTERETYGFKSRNCLPILEEVSNFKYDLMMIIKNIQFKNIQNDFQTKLKNDISDIQKCEEILIPADKSRNVCKIETADYKNFYMII